MILVAQVLAAAAACVAVLLNCSVASLHYVMSISWGALPDVGSKCALYLRTNLSFLVAPRIQNSSVVIPVEASNVCNVTPHPFHRVGCVKKTHHLLGVRLHLQRLQNWKY